jgi:hypothetical protein
MTDGAHTAIEQIALLQNQLHTQPHPPFRTLFRQLRSRNSARIRYSHVRDGGVAASPKIDN